MPIAPVNMPVPKINLSDLISPEEEGKKYIGPNINWEAIPKFLSDLLTLMDPSGMMLATAPISKATSTFTPEYRKTLLGGLANTPEKKKLLEKVMPSLEEYIKVVSERAPGSEVHTIGSFATPQFVPGKSDFDAFASLNPKSWARALGYRPKDIPKELHITDWPQGKTSSKLKEGVSTVEDLFKSKNEEKSWFRLLGAVGLMPLSGMIEGEAQAQEVNPEWGLRTDGTPKGKGFLGTLQRPDGMVSTELSIGVNIGGKETLIPSLVPTLDKKEIDFLLNSPMDPKIFQTPMGKGIMDKAVEHAKGRISEGKSPFAQEGEQTFLGKE